MYGEYGETRAMQAGNMERLTAGWTSCREWIRYREGLCKMVVTIWNVIVAGLDTPVIKNRKGTHFIKAGSG
jgi:hypothetical protein